MRELIKKEQLVTIVPQDFKNSNKGKVLDVDFEGFKMQLKYKQSILKYPLSYHLISFYSSFRDRKLFSTMWTNTHKIVLFGICIIILGI